MGGDAGLAARPCPAPLTRRPRRPWLADLARRSGRGGVVWVYRPPLAVPQSVECVEHSLDELPPLVDVTVDFWVLAVRHVYNAVPVVGAHRLFELAQRCQSACSASVMSFPSVKCRRQCARCLGTPGLLAECHCWGLIPGYTGLNVLLLAKPSASRRSPSVSAASNRFRDSWSTGRANGTVKEMRLVAELVPPVVAPAPKLIIDATLPQRRLLFLRSHLPPHRSRQRNILWPSPISPKCEWSEALARHAQRD